MGQYVFTRKQRYYLGGWGGMHPTSHKSYCICPLFCGSLILFGKPLKKLHTFHNHELGIRYCTTKGCQVPSLAASSRTLVLNPWFEWNPRSLLTVHISSYFFFFPCPSPLPFLSCIYVKGRWSH
jgi:hypothetical protein